MCSRGLAILSMPLTSKSFTVSSEIYLFVIPRNVLDTKIPLIKLNNKGKSYFE